MKRTYIFVIVALSVLLGMISNLSMAQQSATENPEQIVDQNAPQQTAPPVIAEANEAVEPNTEPISGFEEALEELDSQNQAELREWNYADFDRKPRLMRAINTRLQAEFQILRQIAFEEGAEKTVVAIDVLIEKSNQRYEQEASNLEDEARQTRLEQRREERQQRLEERRQRREDRRQQRQRDQR